RGREFLGGFDVHAMPFSFEHRLCTLRRHDDMRNVGRPPGARAPRPLRRPPRSRRAMRNMENPPIQPTFKVDGNSLTMLDTGPRRLDALIALIDGAVRSLRMIYYI